MIFRDGNISIVKMENNLRILRKLRAGLHGARLADDSDVAVRSLDGVPNGNDPSAESRTVADMFRSAREQLPKDWP